MLSCFSHIWLLCDLMGCSPPGSSVHGILQARILEWVAISFSRVFSNLEIEPTSRLLCLLHWQVGSLLLAPPNFIWCWFFFHLCICMLLYIHSNNCYIQVYRYERGEKQWYKEKIWDLKWDDWYSFGISHSEDMWLLMCHLDFQSH